MVYRSIAIHDKIKMILLYILAFSSLWFGYAAFVAPVFGYEGFEWAPDVVKVVESLLALICTAWFLPSKIKRPSDFFLHVQFLLPIVPMLVMYAASDQSREYMFYVLLALIAVCWVRKLDFPKIRGGFIRTQWMMWGFLTLVAIYVSFVIMQGGLRYFNLDLLRVYDFRRDAAANLPGIAGYLSPMMGNVILPVLLLTAMYRRKWLMAGLAFLGSVTIFGLTNHKGMLVYPFVVLGVYCIFNFARRPIYFLILSYIFAIWTSMGLYLVARQQSLVPSATAVFAASMLLRRGYFIPPLLNFGYYEYFSSHPYTLWAESKMTFGLVDYPYALSYPNLIGEYLFNRDTTWASTGWFGTGYMHLGLGGMLFYAVIVGLVLTVVDGLGKGKELSVFAAMFFVPLLGLSFGSDVPTVMLTHGFLLTLGIAWLCGFRKKVRPETGESALCLKRKCTVYEGNFTGLSGK